jgi:hypothetical protein
MPKLHCGTRHLHPRIASARTNSRTTHTRLARVPQLSSGKTCQRHGDTPIGRHGRLLRTYLSSAIPATKDAPSPPLASCSSRRAWPSVCRHSPRARAQGRQSPSFVASPQPAVRPYSSKATMVTVRVCPSHCCASPNQYFLSSENWFDKTGRVHASSARAFLIAIGCMSRSTC